ncbi:transporter substrate-binding domain-containing protein [Paucibacter sp. APW11]|uniref:Transporter substrate-binding domain-containing protein n=1 Tax=Roseateles aquae TaxID=3077235 RepID=A0ABU3PH40_9BURK|nr:transporter substrate-binding domain-containing protein [Paucibacter sp. APW11]MDT9001692.1 transporter substrate-binding domain-containing protein [Paucibacter sp. APW11]
MLPALPDSRRRSLLLALAATAAPARPAWASEQALVGYTEDLPPLNYHDKDGAQGFSVELLRLMAIQAGLPLTLEVLPWARALQLAEANPRGLLFSLTRTPEREAQYQWVGPISPRRILIYKLASRRDLKLGSLAELKQAKLGVRRGSAAVQRLLAEGFKPGVNIELGIDDANNLRKLLAGRMDYLLMLDWAAAWNLRQLQLPASTLQPVLDFDVSSAYWYGLRADADSALVKRLQQALDAIKRDGRYERLRQRYIS